jgi:two-component SAPR family response regulator
MGTLDVYTFENEVQFLDQIGILEPALCMIRIDWKNLHGLKVAELVREISPDSRVIMMSETKDYALDAFEAGANGYLLCPLEKNKFMNTVFWSEGK